jgi:hypothetical protein
VLDCCEAGVLWDGMGWPRSVMLLLLLLLLVYIERCAAPVVDRDCVLAYRPRPCWTEQCPIHSLPTSRRLLDDVPDTDRARPNEVHPCLDRRLGLSTRQRKQLPCHYDGIPHLPAAATPRRPCSSTSAATPMISIHQTMHKWRIISCRRGCRC